MAFKKHHLGNYMILSPTGGGKSQYMSKIIDEKDTFFFDDPAKILYVYSEWTPLYNKYKSHPNVVLHNNFPTESLLSNFLQQNGHKVIVLDDMLLQIKKNFDQLSKLYTVQGHHYNTSVFLLTQSGFGHGQKLLSDNSHYFVLMKSKRMVRTVQSLATQLGFGKKLTNAFDSINGSPNYSYILVDAHPKSENNNDYPIRSNIFKNEDTIVYK